MNTFNPSSHARGLICRSIKNTLKQSIKGEISVHTTNDTLIVDIYAVNDIVYRYTQKLTDSEIVQGFSSEWFAQNVVKRYRLYVTNLFFFDKVVDK